jgi:hypothetical protein
VGQSLQLIRKPNQLVVVGEPSNERATHTLKDVVFGVHVDPRRTELRARSPLHDPSERHAQELVAKADPQNGNLDVVDDGREIS